MAHLDFKITYNVTVDTVDTDELRVLLAALTGKLKTEEERATARALGDRLWELRRTRALALRSDHREAQEGQVLVTHLRAADRALARTARPAPTGGEP